MSLKKYENICIALYLDGAFQWQIAEFVLIPQCGKFTGYGTPVRTR